MENYWPDFVMKAGRPETKSQSPNNPAALVRISKLVKQGDAKPSLQFAPADDGIAYQLRRGEQVIGSGKAKVGESFALGWADWQAEVVQSLARAELITETKPGHHSHRANTVCLAFARASNLATASAVPINGSNQDKSLR